MYLHHNELLHQH